MNDVDRSNRPRQARSAAANPSSVGARIATRLRLRETMARGARRTSRDLATWAEPVCIRNIAKPHQPRSLPALIARPLRQESAHGLPKRAFWADRRGASY